MLRALSLVLTLALCLALPAHRAMAQQTGPLQALLQTHADEVASPGRQSVGPLIADLVASGLPQVPDFLNRWSDRDLVQDEATGLFYYDGTPPVDVDTGAPVRLDRASLSAVRPNGGVRRVISTALVQFQLSDPDIAARSAALDAIARAPEPDQLAPLRASLASETDPALRARKEQLVGMLAARFGANSDDRVAAIAALSGALSVEVRAVLNQILTTSPGVAETLPPEVNVARVLQVGDDIPIQDAYARLVDAGRAPPAQDRDQIKAALTANVAGGEVGGVPVGALDSETDRLRAYAALAEAGAAPPLVTQDTIEAALASHVFYEAYAEPDTAVTDAARAALDEVEQRVFFNQMLDLTLDALSLASIYFLAAIGLAITFGVMGVINMAHGEFIMMGAYTGYVVQQIIPDYTLSLIVALPLAFAVTFAAGVAMERLVIRWLYHRPLETLLATFGISIALQQLAKNIFGTQARPLTSPAWLDGAWVLNDVVSIANIRIAIFVLALIFLALILFILNKTRVGLEVRAVTQNPGMAASMGINPDKINMLTFGLGSGIAGIAGVAIGLYAKVTSEMGADYIVQSFMTVVVGGVGNVWGTLAGAALIGILQKGIEYFNPSNTLAAQTYMILFIILFIQFRPKGIVALKGRAAGD
ncbi:branched-chain amino acid ABC transporter permease [Salipiger aestuarii]|uniref:Urea transport system permease protein n=1 Tax=Salipiger aestuarii TaxID=568098 RepID=A0A327Y8X5_9RHOB|nr:urea ABC transporter permease subunit UrtB [Salipiger aestuarii]EIE49626.1 branched-chain amino acid ABC transporter, permease protein, putative [Citreicella sp. 357]KAA8607162.1 branched-chain amino acid ABC transporter permease [Salipiger aestuarii]KAA8611050.1 branched-chain amino acid ABC transporter permease [Salipiger aestuarii]KAB2542284.1 branched-chain amino acid ABC transporter permease [Salipiger aestuarii]RAK16951.1 urea transport system permease protein [Salipiger aestuarii]